jgi:phosphatidylinositol 4-kinase B
LLTLENISNRLLVVPRPARVSALRAELTALNHKLPAEVRLSSVHRGLFFNHKSKVCMPMWCSSSDESETSKKTTQPHHRIVRISPGESVVLNSAERAPYLLLIEILHDDLDFDPTKRSNKEVLKKIVTKEEGRTGTFRDSSFTTSPAPHRSRTYSDQVTGAEAILGEETAESGNAPSMIVMAATSATASSPDEEEIDLVEQLYGTDHSLRSREIDISESIVLPPAPKNKDLDMAAWSRSASVPPPTPEHGSSVPPPSSALPTASRHGRLPRQTQASMSSVNGDGSFLSLDDYSERMRTAAIMLSQLNANLIREPVTPVSLPGMSTNPPESDAPPGSSWLPGSGWLLSSAEHRGPLHPSLAGGPHDNGSSVAPAFRMKLQHSEAAAIRDRIMKEMLALEDERMERMREQREGEGMLRIGDSSYGIRTVEDEGIIRRELNKVDPSAVVFSELWAAKKVNVLIYSAWSLLNADCRVGYDTALHTAI